MSDVETTIEPTATTTAISEYSPTEIALADLRRRTEGVLFEVTTAKGMVAARAARAEIRGYRVDLEAKRVELKAPILERGRLLDAEAKRITAALVELEEPIDEQIKLEERRKEDERRERVRIEEERIAVIKRRIDAIRQMPLDALGKTVGAIQAAVIAAMDVDVELFDPEYREEAQIAVDETIAKLTAMREQRKAQDVEQKRLADERAELARLRKEEDARIAAENEARAATQRVEDEARAARQREEDAARAEADRATQAERDRIAAEQRAENERVAEANRVERERLAAVERQQEEARAAERRAAAVALEAQAAADRARWIAAATLRSAAEECLHWMDDRGYGTEPEAETLRGVLAREEAAE